MARSAASAVDGRAERAARSRLAICEACLDLVQEGVLQPSADQIAERAGLSRRSIFYHFQDLAELYDAVAEAGMQRFDRLLTEIPPERPLGERVALLADARAKFFEATAPFARALTAQCLVGSARDQASRVARDALKRQRTGVEQVFARDLDALPLAERTETLEALSAAASPALWEHLRRSRGLSMGRAHGVLARTLSAILRDAGLAL